MSRFYLLLSLLIIQSWVTESSNLKAEAGGPKERALHDARMSMVPIINPIEIHSPYFPGMAHDMLEEVEKIADKDTNIPMAPTPIGDGYDPQEIFTDIGKVLPQKIVQMMRSNLGRKWYVKHMIRDMVFKGMAAAAPVLNMEGKEELNGGDHTAYKDSHKIDYKLFKIPSEAPPKSIMGGQLNKVKNMLPKKM